MNTFSVTHLSLLLLLILCFSCGKQNPNVDNTGEDGLKALEIDRSIRKEDKRFEELVYVPIYSDIYMDQQNHHALLSATLSIRNTSYSDSLFISKIDYFNTTGMMVRGYIKKPISLPPMGTINYVIEKEDDKGGSGANFIVEISAKNNDMNPLIQAIMIGQTGNKSFAFSTDGYPITKN